MKRSENAQSTSTTPPFHDDGHASVFHRCSSLARRVRHRRRLVSRIGTPYSLFRFFSFRSGLPVFRAFARGSSPRNHSSARMLSGAPPATLVVAYTAGGKDSGRARSGERTSSSGRRGRARGGRGRRRGESGEGGSQPASETSGFRGAWLDPAARNTGAAPRMSSKTTKALIKAHGEEEYQFYVTFHVDRYMRLGRELGRWRRDFVTQRGREPQYEDMPQRIRNMEQTMLHIGFKLSNLE